MMTTAKFEPTERELSDKIRWMIRRDLASILKIEAGQEHPWSEDDFVSELRRGDVVGMVADIKGEIAGYLVYEIQKFRFLLTNFVVSPAWRGLGVGRLMLTRLSKKLSARGRKSMAMYVRETNLAMQQFLRAMGFKASKVARSHFADTGEDAFLMEFQCR